MPHPKQQITVLITAGHAATTALATIEAMRSDSEHIWNISWVGPKVSLEGTTLKPFELELFPKLGVSVYSISAGKLQSKFTRHTVPALIKVPIGFLESLQKIRKIKPDVVLSFGGYAAVPVVAAAYLMGIPVVLHEQTVAAGLANKITGFLATKIALARSESINFFPRQKSVVVGNPLMPEILKVKTTTTLASKPVIYVTGGSRGAQRVNNPIFESLSQLLTSYRVIHQTGQLDHEKALRLRGTLTENLKRNYEVHSFINPLEVGKIYQQADLVIGRAGANTVSEVMALGIPSIFIPIPWSRSDEQTKNARTAEALGLSIVLPESRLNSKVLLETVREVFNNWKKMKQCALANMSQNKDIKAAVSLRDLVAQVLS